MDKLDFLSGGQAPAEEPVVAPAAEPASEGPARGPDGRFVSQQADPPAEPEAPPAAAPEPVAESPPAVAAPVAATPEPAPDVRGLLAATLDEREKRQKLESELAQLRQQLAAQQPQPQGPDYWENPQAYTQTAVQQAVINERLNFSETLARQQHGAEVVEQAKQWAIAKMGQSPAFQQEVLGNPHPYDFAIQAYQREQMFSQVKPDEFAAFKAWQAAQAQAAAQPQAAPAATPQPVAAPPRSLASATSAGGAQAVPTGDGQAFDTLFKR